jgi:hypothetical protein
MGSLGLGITNVFTNPAEAGTHAWSALFVPYQPGTGILSTQLAAQSTSYARLPVALAVTIKRQHPRGTTFVARVCLRENGQPVPGVRVQIMGRPRPSGGFTQYANARTGARGRVTRRFRPGHKVTYGQVWTHPLRRPATDCSGAFAARCSRPTLATAYFQRRFRIHR